MITPASDAQALECRGIKDPTIVSKCDGGKCVAKEMCNKPLSDKEFEIPGGSTGSDPLKPTPIDVPPTPTTPINPSPMPTTPITKPDLTPTPSPGTGTGGGGAGGSVPNPVPDTELPPVEVTQNPVPRPGTTFNPGGSPFTLGPRPSNPLGGSTFGQSPGNVFGDPFQSGSNTTFTGSFGSFGGSPSVAGPVGNFISMIVANLFSNLFSGFGGGSLSSGVSAPSPTASAPRPAPSPAPALAPPQPVPRSAITVTPPQSPPRPIADVGTMPENIANEIENYFRLPQPTTDQPPYNVGNPAPMPQDDMRSPGGITPQEPELAPWPERPSPTRPLTRELATAEFERARGDLENRSLFGRVLDRLGVGSPQGVAYQQALRDLAAITKAESLNLLALQQVRTMPGRVQVAEGGPVMTDASPAELEALEDVENRLTPAQREQLEVEYQRFVREFDAATPERQLEMLDEAQRELHEGERKVQGIREEFEEALGFTPGPIPPTPQPAQRPSTMLEGLSRIGERVLDAARRTAQSVARVFNRVSDDPPLITAPPSTSAVIPPPGSASQPGTATAEPIPQPVPTNPQNPPVSPAPETPPAPQNPQPARASSGFVQGGMNLLSALVQGLVGFFTGGNDTQSSAQPARPSQPSQPAPAASASITANPNTVDDGDTTVLSWSSVGTLGCVVVDSTLKTIARGGANGDLTSPALTESTRFGVICNIEGGRDKFINETLVRVRGDEREPVRLFAQTGRASTAPPASDSTGGSSGGGVASGTDGQSGNPAPRDVRTCNPEQPMDSFIRCLCEAEPNPAGCAVPPGGV